MERSVEPLREQEGFTEFLRAMDNPVKGTFAGMLITLIIQSSSATVGMAIVLVKKGLLGLTGGIAIMMGAELGTVSDTLLATIKGTRTAIKTGLFHFIFNLLSIITGLIAFYPFTDLVIQISHGAGPERTLANAHMIFNIAGVCLFAWLIPLFEKWLNKILPDRLETQAAS
jgi:phosphate:Na+ symporter